MRDNPRTRERGGLFIHDRGRPCKARGGGGVEPQKEDGYSEPLRHSEVGERLYLVVPSPRAQRQTKGDKGGTFV